MTEIKRYRFLNRKPVKPMNRVQYEAREAIEEKIRSGIYVADSVFKCICGHAVFEPVAERDRYGMNVSIIMCGRCGLLVQSPRFTEKSYEQFYKQEYRQLYSINHHSEPYILFETEVRRGKEILEFFNDHDVSLAVGNILDVGCGCGGALQPFEAFGWKGCGFDYDDVLIKYGKSRKLNIFTESAYDFNEKGRAFNLVLMNDVLEHQRDPLVFLAKIKKILTPTGLVYVQLPGLRKLVYNSYPDILRDFQLAHTYYFDLKLLDSLMFYAGFERVCGNERIQALYRRKRVTQSLNEINMDNYALEIKKFIRDLEKRRFRLFWKNRKLRFMHNPIPAIQSMIFFIRQSLY